MVTLTATKTRDNTRLSTEIANIIELNGFDDDDAMMAWLDGTYDNVVKLEEDADKLKAAQIELDRTKHGFLLMRICV